MKTKYTLADDEPLFSPQDYAKIDIDERVSTSEFSEFAGNVCNIRLRRIQEGSGTIRCPEINIKLLLERLDMEAEAIKLGIKERNKSINESISRLTSLVNIDKLHQLTELQKFYIYYLVEKNQTSLEREIRAYLEKDSNWFTNFENYKFDLLFKIRTGKVGVVKYYCGWETYVGLSGNNIRFILMLLESTLLTAVKDNRGSLPFKIDAETQTKSCKDVAQSVFDEIAGLSYDGPQYQQIVVGFGKIFSFYARNIVKKSPELNQFNISDISLHKETEEFVRRCVMHYVLLESKETKQTRRDEISEYDYSLHPIFSPKFNYSNRRGRKFSINSETFERIKQNPEYGVKSILKESARADERGGLFD